VGNVLQLRRRIHLVDEVTVAIPDKELYLFQCVGVYPLQIGFQRIVIFLKTNSIVLRLDKLPKPTLH
jgi:hypothetical protein